MKKLIIHYSFQEKKKIILGVFLFVVIVCVFGWFYSSTQTIYTSNNASQKLVFNIPAMGNLPALNDAMAENKLLRHKVKELISYDENYLFVNYLQVNDLLSDIMLLWIGLTPQQIEKNSKKDLISYFLRRVYGLPDDEPIANNPLLEAYPWASLFQRIKAKLLMQGSGHKIYDGVAYFDSNKDMMVVEGNLSEPFAKALGQFISARPQKDRKKFINNYLMFIDATLGLKNLSKKEKDFLKREGFL